MKKQTTIAGNWKMNPQTLAEAKKLFAVYVRMAKKNQKRNFFISIPAVYLHALGSRARSKNLSVAAQNVYFEDAGSYTGAISIPMVRDCGANAVLIGHSERRNIFGVSNEVVQKKVEHALGHGMHMVVCFGEHERDEQGTYAEELEEQIKAIVTPFIDSRKIKLLTLAYEPVWAIGSAAKRSVTTDELFSTLLLIKNILRKYLTENQVNKIPIWYGGSVNDTNAAELSAVPGVDGFLIGRASLDAERIRTITTVSS